MAKRKTPRPPANSSVLYHAELKRKLRREQEIGRLIGRLYRMVKRNDAALLRLAHAIIETTAT